MSSCQCLRCFFSIPFSASDEGVPSDGVPTDDDDHDTEDAEVVYPTEFELKQLSIELAPRCDLRVTRAASMPVSEWKRFLHSCSYAHM